MKSLILLLLSSTFVLVAQEKTTNVKPKWIIGIGANFIDNTATKDNQFFTSSKRWNYVPSVSKLSLERILSDKFSIECAVGINTISADKMQNGGSINEDQKYLGADLNGKFYFGKALYKCPAIDPFIVGGFGINKVGEITNRTPIYGYGINLWLNPSFGLRLQTLGKYGITQNTLMNNHIQHSAELVIKF